jgi:carotenoid cleavage dioxygenase
VDERTGELMFFNYSTRAPYLHYGVVDRRRRVTHYVPIELPGPRLPHDIAFTERYTILNDLPLFWDRELIDQGLYVSRFHPEVPSRFGILPRHGAPEEIRWFDAAPTYVLHWANAFEDGDQIVLDGFFESEPEPAEAGPAGPVDRMFRFLAADALGARLHRWRFDLSTGATEEEDLSDRTSEFGAVNGRGRGRAHRYVYATSNSPGWFLMDGVLRHDTLTGAVEHYQFPDGVFCSEPAVVPGAREGEDAYLVTIVIDVNEDRSFCAVFDAARVGDGPVASVALPERVSSGTHAFWASGSDIPGWA